MISIDVQTLPPTSTQFETEISALQQLNIQRTRHFAVLVFIILAVSIMSAYTISKFDFSFAINIIVCSILAISSICSGLLLGVLAQSVKQSLVFFLIFSSSFLTLSSGFGFYLLDWTLGTRVLLIILAWLIYINILGIYGIYIIVNDSKSSVLQQVYLKPVTTNIALLEDIYELCQVNPVCATYLHRVKHSGRILTTIEATALREYAEYVTAEEQCTQTAKSRDNIQKAFEP